MALPKTIQDFIDVFINKTSAVNLDTDEAFRIIEHIVSRRRIFERFGKLNVDYEHIRITETVRHECKNCEKQFYMSKDSANVKLCPYCGITFEASELF